MSNVVDLSAARARLAGDGSPVNPILAALDALGLALADHGHTWTDRERSLYETAVSYMTCGGTEFRFVPTTPTDDMLREGVRVFQETYSEADTLADWRAFYATVQTLLQKDPAQ